MSQIVVPALLEQVPVVTAFVDQLLEAAGCHLKAQMQIDIAIDEIFSNICLYSGSQKAIVTCLIEEGRCTLTFADNGDAYDPLAKADPDVTLSAEDRNIGGLGIFMVKKTMDSMSYARVGQQNVLTLVKAI